MANRVLLNNVDHHDLRIAPGAPSSSGGAVNQMPIVPTEFEEAARDYPILFRQDSDGAFHAVALLGLDRDENLFLEGEQWSARHIPILFQRGPFSIGLQRQNDPEAPAEPMIHVDLEDPRIGRGKGIPLFLPHGGNSRYLDQMARILQAAHVGIDVAARMFTAFGEHDLIAPLRLEVQLSDGRQYTLPNHHGVDAERLAALDGAALERLNREGLLRLAFIVLGSLGNFARLIELKDRRLAAAAPRGDG